MTTTTEHSTVIHFPIWQRDGEEYVLLAGNKTVARIIPNSDPRFPQYNWLSLIESEYDNTERSWHAVDFGGLETAQHHLANWWVHRSHGKQFLCDCHSEYS